jgi:hypothetical protein
VSTLASSWNKKPRFAIFCRLHSSEVRYILTQPRVPACWNHLATTLWPLSPSSIWAIFGVSWLYDSAVRARRKPIRHSEPHQTNPRDMDTVPRPSRPLQRPVSLMKAVYAQNICLYCASCKLNIVSKELYALIAVLIATLDSRTLKCPGSMA